MSLEVIVAEKEPGVFIISPAGSIDTNSYKILSEKVDSVLDKSPEAIIFDMEGVSYTSSAGVRVVLKARKALRQKEGKVLLVNLKPMIKKVFEAVYAPPSQQIFTSIEELDRYLDRIQKETQGEES